jgi:regulatory factor X 4
MLVYATSSARLSNDVLAESRRFVQMLRRQSSLSQLCQASRTVVQNSELASHMMADWNSVDVSSICKQTLYTMDKYTERDHKIIIKRTSLYL